MWRTSTCTPTTTTHSRTRSWPWRMTPQPRTPTGGCALLLVPCCVCSLTPHLDLGLLPAHATTGAYFYLFEENAHKAHTSALAWLPSLTSTTILDVTLPDIVAGG